MDTQTHVFALDDRLQNVVFYPSLSLSLSSLLITHYYFFYHLCGNDDDDCSLLHYLPLCEFNFKIVKLTLLLLHRLPL